MFVIAVEVVAGFFCAQEIRQREEKNRVSAFLNILFLLIKQFDYHLVQLKMLYNLFTKLPVNNRN